MTPDERKAALAKFQAMPPTEDREALRKAIEASDELSAALANEQKRQQELQRAAEVHAAAEEHRAKLQEAHEASSGAVRELLLRLEVVAPEP